jgi:hypothetical protein
VDVGVHAAEDQHDDAVLPRGGVKAFLKLPSLVHVPDDGLTEVSLEDQVIEPRVFPGSERACHPSAL